jgi:hypothetical protein
MRAGASAACGKAMALGPAALALLPAVGGCAGGGQEHARRLHAAGERVVLVDAAARIPQPPHVPLSAALARFTRWLRVLRAHRPALWTTVPLLLAPTPLLLTAVLVLGSPLVAIAVVCLVAGRTVLARRLAPETGRGDWMLGETPLLAAFVCSLRTRRIRWRGRVFDVARGGHMRADAA